MSADGAGFGAAWSAGLATGTDAERQAWLDFALASSAAADAVALRWFRRDVEVTRKADRSLVTAADTAIERLVRERIADAFPTHGVVGEEYGTAEGSGEARWYIDPIDSTANFVRGIPVFATLLALEMGGELQVGVMSAPALGECWFAARGLGAWATGGSATAAATAAETPRRLHVSSVGAVGDAHVLHGELDGLARSVAAAGFDRLVADAWRSRGFGDFWMYGLLAEGTAEVVIEPDLNSWDLAAPAIVVEEAGGRVTDWTGSRTIHGRTALATNGILHDEVLRRLGDRPR